MGKKIMQEVHHYNKTDFLFSTYKFYKGVSLETIPLHVHEEIEVIYFIKGSALYEIDFSKYLVDSESIVIINKNIVHGVKSVNFEEAEGLVYIFNSNLLEGSIDDFGSSKYMIPLINGQTELPIIIKAEDNRELFEYLKKILFNTLEIYEEKKYAYELKIKVRILEFFAHLFENNYVKTKNYSEKDILKRKKMEKIFYYIHQNYRKNISLEEVANILSFSETYFSKFFKEYTGDKFIDYLNYYRLTQSAQLLINTEMAITEICYETGFQNLSYFIRTFKKTFIFTPSEYRKNYAKSLI